MKNREIRYFGGIALSHRIRLAGGAFNPQKPLGRPSHSVLAYPLCLPQLACFQQGRRRRERVGLSILEGIKPTGDGKREEDRPFPKAKGSGTLVT
jgi:hypothetical protein